MKYGYARVSTEDQRTHAQTDALVAAGCDVIYEERRSGGTMARPLLQKMLADLKPGDVVVVYKMDRIARSLLDLMTIQDRIQATGAGFKSLTEVIDTASAAGRMIFQILGAFAEFERAIIRERTLVGLRAARERGRVGGQRSKIPHHELSTVVQLHAEGVTLRSIAELYGTHVSSVKRALVRGRLQSESRDARDACEVVMLE